MLMLRTLLILLCCCVSRATGVIDVWGYLGRDVNVSCPYGRGYETYEKYLCKNDCGNSDVLITTSDTKNVKFSISDERSLSRFIVTIYNLSSSDAGKYWCGVSRSGKDLYDEVKLQIEPDSCCSDVVQIQSHEEGSVSVTCPYPSKYQTKLKYICRGNQPSTCLQRAVITSEKTPSGRLTLTDDQMAGKFTVTISRLMLEDSGPYLCGVNSCTGLLGFSAVQLEVKEWCCVTSSNVTGTEGQAVTLQCPYPPQHQDNRKFLCKGDRRNNCTDMVTNRSRFTLQDDVSSSSFSVTVMEVEAEDAGTYWCGSDSQWRAGNYTQIQLSVLLKDEKVISPGNDKPASDTILLIVVVTVVSVLLVLIFTTIICTLKCHQKKQEADVLALTNIPKQAGVEDETRPDVYSNQEFVERAKQNSCHYDNDVDEEQPDYENLRTEEIYCNQDVFRANIK